MTEQECGKLESTSLFGGKGREGHFDRGRNISLRSTAATQPCWPCHGSGG
jgi:hypothetical protein